MKAVAALVLLFLASSAWARPAELPPAVTPGVVAEDGHDAAGVCGTVGGLSYSKRHRATPTGLKAMIRKRDHAIGVGEVDHRLPLALGGADVVYNLWWQPGPDAPGVTWNFHDKDRLEVEIWERVCKRHTMTLEDGQAIFLAPDWTEQYCKVWPEECR